MEICLITRVEICTYPVKENLSCHHFNTLLLRTLMSMHFIISYHPCHYLCIHDILFHAHTYRITRRSNPTRIQRRGVGKLGDTLARSSRRWGAGPRRTTRVPWPPTHFFPERQASKHSKPPMFYKISLESFMFDALGYKSWFGNTWCVELPCPVIYFKSCVGLGSNICLAMLRPVEVEWFPVTCEI